MKNLNSNFEVANPMTGVGHYHGTNKNNRETYPQKNSKKKIKNLFFQSSFFNRVFSIEFFQSKFWPKIEILAKNRNFDQKSKFWPKIKILNKNRNFGQEIKILTKNRNFGQKSKC